MTECLPRPRPFLGALAAVMLLAACNSGGDNAGEPNAQASDATLAAMVADVDDMSVAGSALTDAGLAQVLDGAAAYTVLVPRDTAFDALGEAGEALRAPEQRPAMIAVLRDHIVPGYLTPEDISKAIDLADNGKVTMRTMGAHTLTFSEENGTIVARNEDGSTAKFAGDALRASNGVAIPVDGVLKQLAAPAG